MCRHTHVRDCLHVYSDNSKFTLRLHMGQSITAWIAPASALADVTSPCNRGGKAVPPPASVCSVVCSQFTSLTLSHRHGLAGWRTALSSACSLHSRSPAPTFLALHLSPHGRSREVSRGHPTARVSPPYASPSRPHHGWTDRRHCPIVLLLRDSLKTSVGGLCSHAWSPSLRLLGEESPQILFQFSAVLFPPC